MTYWDFLLQDLDAKLLVFARFLGIFAFNPMLSMKNLPAAVRVLTALAVTLGALTVIDVNPIDTVSTGVFALMLLKEGFIGVVLGFVTQLFLSSTLLSGEIMDMQEGLSMSRIYDPGAGVQMPLMGTVTSYMLYLLFFASNSHLTYIRLMTLSFDMIPIGEGGVNTSVWLVITDYFVTTLVLGLKLAMPMLAAQMIMEVCMGILMKAVPQIQVMVVNMQMKMLLGLFLTVLFTPIFASFLDTVLDTMNDALYNTLPAIIAQS